MGPGQVSVELIPSSLLPLLTARSIRPLEMVMSVSPVQYLRETLPGMKAILARPVSVEQLAKVGVAAALGDVYNRTDGIFHVEDIHTVAK